MSGFKLDKKFQSILIEGRYDRFPKRPVQELRADRQVGGWEIIVIDAEGRLWVGTTFSGVIDWFEIETEELP